MDQDGKEQLKVDLAESMCLLEKDASIFF